MFQSSSGTYRVRYLLARGALISACLLCFHPPAVSQVFLKNRFPNISFSSPVGLYHPNDGTDRLCVVEQAGVIRIFPDDTTITSTKAFLDIHDSVVSGGELGLLGLAFHPSYATNGYFYVDYTRDHPLRTVISRFRVSVSNPDSADPASEFIILEQLQPFDNHNGGQLAFGPDGYLYIAFGDGGSGGDPFGNGQNRDTLLGKILRINVDSATGQRHYAIPPDNPYYGDTTKKQEIFAYGMRNPWRFSFDGSALWCADVGQGLWEEIDTVTSGGNYGWNIMEGHHCYSPSSGCDTSGLTPPIWEYYHEAGRCAIVGGFVYRGAALPALSGRYIYGDDCTGEIWALTPVPSSPPSNEILINSGMSISSFGEDRLQEIYVCDLNSGKVYKLSGTATASVDYHMMKSWNLISLPVGIADSRRSILFPSAGSPAFEYDPATGYRVRDTLVPGTGYWLKFGDTATIGLLGTPRNADTIDVAAGWNLIGSLSQSIATAQVSSIPGGMVTSRFFGYQGSYTVSNTIDPGHGYWVKVNQTGKLILVSGAGGAQPGAIRIVPTMDLPPGPPYDDPSSTGSGVPNEYSLAQNYPNPFNPATTIHYTLPLTGFVTLKVYDVLGEEVATLVHGFQESGYKSATWDATNFPSGIYVYRLTSGGFADTKKMMVVR
ncbi:MAG TPA: PQQ-dependent sugar dehydrogenase [Bacteroidota bacterium]|nr:PQQ-dependent sugar dehydrogenase [Bacteroidota bacterium]